MATDGRILTVGAAAVDLDIFITAGQNGAPTDPSGITYRMFDPAGVEAVTTTSGNRVSIGGYNASGTIIPTGFVLGEDWQIVWDVVLPGGASGQFIEEFCVAVPTLAASFANPVDNSIESLFDRVRIDLGDPDGLIFTDGLLRRTVRKSVSRINRRLGLVKVCEDTHFIWLIAFTSRVSTPVLELNLETGTISPDTDPYADILVLQMEEILLTSESVALGRLNVNTAGTLGSGIQGVAGDGVSVTNADGVSITKSVGRLQHRATMMKHNLDMMKEQLEHAIKDLRWRLSGCAGKDVSIPRYHSFGHGGGLYGGGY
jgi:hypothetical protein